MSKKAEYRPERGKLLAAIFMNGKAVCIFRKAPTDEQGRAMADALEKLESK